MRRLSVLAALLLTASALAGHASAPPPAKWTFLIYMDADNNLEQWGIADFLEMATVGSSPTVNIVVQMDRAVGYDATYGDWTDTRRFFVTKGLTPDPVKNLPSWAPREINMADPANLTDFVNWGMAAYPADHYFLDLWDHGDGWQGVAYDDAPVPNARLTPADIRGAMQTVIATNGRSVDVIGYDACRMTLEVDYELVDVADYFVGSEKDEPDAGWPYDTFLGGVVANPAMSPPEVASLLADKYVESYVNNSAYSVAMSVVNAGDLRPLAASLDGFLTEVTAEEPYFAVQVVQARAVTEHYEIGGHAGGLEYDLYHFVENVIGGLPSRRVERVGSSLLAAIQTAVVHERHWDNPGAEVAAAHAHGISLYFPTIGGDVQYGQLALSRDSLWDEFLATYALGIRPNVAGNATASTVSGRGGALLDTIDLRYTPAVNGTMAVDVYRDGAYVLSHSYAAVANRTAEARYLFLTGGYYEVTFYLFAGGKLQNLTIIPNLAVEQPITFRGQVTGDSGPLDGATVTLVDLANGKTVSTTTSGGQYAITVNYPTWFRDGDPLELRVSLADRGAHLEFNGTAGSGTVVHDLALTNVSMGPWIATMIALAGVAAVGLGGMFYFWRRLRKFTHPPKP